VGKECPGFKTGIILHIAGILLTGIAKGFEQESKFFPDFGENYPQNL
jgi:hypothetical protein